MKLHITQLLTGVGLAVVLQVTGQEACVFDIGMQAAALVDAGRGDGVGVAWDEAGTRRYCARTPKPNHRSYYQGYETYQQVADEINREYNQARSRRHRQ